VEAMGIEPMSAKQLTKSATCLSLGYTQTLGQEHPEI